MKRGISDTKRYVVDIAVAGIHSVVKINHTLPEEIEMITACYLSIAHIAKLAGICSLRFADGASNSLLLQRLRNDPRPRKKRTYVPLCEYIPQGSTLQGFYRNQSDTDQPYTVKIYIEFVPRQCKPAAK